LEASWLLFEAGALSKTLDRETRVFTYLLGGLAPGDVSPPLGQFQGTVANKERTASMFQDINQALGSQVREDNLSELFDKMVWPDLEQKLSSMPKPEKDAPAKRSLEEMIEEILENSRAIPQMREDIHEVGDHMSRRAASLVEALKPVRDQSLFQRIGSPSAGAVAGLGGVGSLKELMEVPEPRDKEKE